MFPPRRAYTMPPSPGSPSSPSSSHGTPPGIAPQRFSRSSPGKTSAIIESLQSELVQVKAQLDRAKTEVRNCRREIGALTRRSEDLRDTRDRMRGEADSLSNVISRKERMVAELAERVRTAESSAETYASQRAEVEERALERVREAEERTSVAEEARARAESDFQALRGSIASLKAMWAREVRGYRDEMDRRDDELRRERAEWEAKRTELLALVNSQATEHKNVLAIVDAMNANHAEAAKRFSSEIGRLRADVERSTAETEQSASIAAELAAELELLRSSPLASRAPNGPSERNEQTSGSPSDSGRSSSGSPSTTHLPAVPSVPGVPSTPQLPSGPNTAEAAVNERKNLKRLDISASKDFTAFASSDDTDSASSSSPPTPDTSFDSTGAETAQDPTTPVSAYPTVQLYGRPLGADLSPIAEELQYEETPTHGRFEDDGVSVYSRQSTYSAFSAYSTYSDDVPFDLDDDTTLESMDLAHMKIVVIEAE